MKKKVLISFAALGLLFSGIVGCNNNNNSAAPASEGSNSAPASAEQSADPSSAAPSSSEVHVHTFDETKWESNETQHWHPATCEHTNQKGSAAAHTFEEVAAESTPATCTTPGVLVEKCTVCNYKRETAVKADHDFQDADSGHEKAEGEVTQTFQKCSRDATYKIAWDAQDAAKKSSNFDSDGKFSRGGYAEYTFYSPFYMKARMYARIADRSSESQYNRETQTGNQSIWFDYYNGPDWKYTVKVNDEKIDQDASSDVAVGDQTFKMKEILYTDFLESGATELVAPWFEFTVKKGQNTIRIERYQGYSVSVKDFRVIGEEIPEPFAGYNATFVAEHCKVYVYETKQYETETPVEATSAIARDETGAIVPYDVEDIELQPQVSFKVVCDEGYSVTANNVVVTPKDNYKNLKQNPDNKEGQENIFRITKVKGDITITITPVQGEQAQGYKVKFNATNAQVKVYIGPKAETGDNLDEPDDGGFYYARLKDAPYDIGFTTPQLNFEVVCDNGYEFNPTITDDKVDFITFTPADGKVGYNKFKQNADGTFNMTKIDSDLTITITATAAQSNAIVLDYTGLSNDTSSEITGDAVLAKIGQGNAHVTAATASKIYCNTGSGGAYPNANGMIKGGTGSANGVITLTLDVDVTKVEIKCHDFYKKSADHPTNSNSVVVNTLDAQLAPYNEEGTFETLTFELAAGSKEITITTQKRVYIQEIKLS